VVLSRIIFLTFFLVLVLNARDNPFFPTKGEVDIPYTSNAKTALPPLKRATIAIPSQARTIKKVTVEFINLDGSTQNISIELNNAVDWYLPIFISQSMGDLHAEKTKEQQKNLDPKKKKYKQFYNLGFIKFYKRDKEIRVITNDFMIRDFLLTKPHRIVMDFQSDLNMNSQVKTLKGRYYKKISFGVHENYYRIVLELDGVYKYKKQRKKKGYSFLLY